MGDLIRQSDMDDHSDDSNTTTHFSPCHQSHALMGLPPEIRQRMFYFIFFKVMVRRRWDDPIPPPGIESIMLTCKLLRQESLPLFFRQVEFKIEPHQRYKNLPQDLNLLRRIHLCLQNNENYTGFVQDLLSHPSRVPKQLTITTNEFDFATLLHNGNSLWYCNPHNGYPFYRAMMQQLLLHGIEWRFHHQAIIELSKCFHSRSLIIEKVVLTSERHMYISHHQRLIADCHENAEFEKGWKGLLRKLIHSVGFEPEEVSVFARLSDSDSPGERINIDLMSDTEFSGGIGGGDAG